MCNIQWVSHKSWVPGVYIIQRDCIIIDESHIKSWVPESNYRWVSDKSCIPEVIIYNKVVVWFLPARDFSSGYRVVEDAKPYFESQMRPSKIPIFGRKIWYNHPSKATPLDDEPGSNLR